MGFDHYDAVCVSRRCGVGLNELERDVAPGAVLHTLMQSNDRSNNRLRVGDGDGVSVSPPCHDGQLAYCHYS